MRKPFNWVGFILICVYIIGLFLFGFGIFQCKTNPQSAIIQFSGGSAERAISFLSFFGGIFLIIGGIFVALLYKLFSMKTALKGCPELTAPVKVVSKARGANYHSVSYNPSRKVLTSYVFFIVCEFQDGSRKNFRVTNIEVYNTILENDTGILTYKEHGKHTLFIAFQRQS